jgi:hypothetical protein
MYMFMTLPYIRTPSQPTAFYDSYCRTVEGTAEWGGELELRALVRVIYVIYKSPSFQSLSFIPYSMYTHTRKTKQCHALEAPITVYSAEAPPLQMGQDEYGDRSAPLRLTYVSAFDRWSQD